MKKYFFSAFIILFASTAFFMTSCAKKCDAANDVKVGTQTLSITYLDANGQNYLDGSHWNLGNVHIFVDTTGGKNPTPVELPIDLVNKKFGPYYYTKNFINPTTKDPILERLLAKTYTFDYIIVKDNSGTDVVRVKFELTADECNTLWRVIDFYLKKDGETKFTKMDKYSLSETAEIILVQ